ncbi:hypothetical protein ACFLW3_00700 [Chloroflexota bacterium]
MAEEDIEESKEAEKKGGVCKQCGVDTEKTVHGRLAWEQCPKCGGRSNYSAV